MDILFEVQCNDFHFLSCLFKDPKSQKHLFYTQADPFNSTLTKSALKSDCASFSSESSGATVSFLYSQKRH